MSEFDEMSHIPMSGQVPNSAGFSYACLRCGKRAKMKINNKGLPQMYAYCEDCARPQKRVEIIYASD